MRETPAETRAPGFPSRSTPTPPPTQTSSPPTAPSSPPAPPSPSTAPPQTQNVPPADGSFFQPGTLITFTVLDNNTANVTWQRNAGGFLPANGTGGLRSINTNTG